MTEQTEKELNKPVSESKEQPKEESTEEVLAEIDYGYSVGVDKEGKLVFELLGNPPPGVVQLLGLNKFAERNIDTMVAVSTKTGEANIVDGINVLFRKLLEIEKYVVAHNSGNES